MKVLLKNVTENWNKFLELHADPNVYGGSTVANICGVGYLSPLDEWLERTGKKDDTKQTDQMFYGQFMEPFILQLFENRTEMSTVRVNEIWQHDDLEWAIATPDGETAAGDLVECKAHKIYAEKYWGEETASDSAQCQLQWYMGIGGRAGGYCAALIGGDTDKFFTPYFKADPELFAQMVEQVEKFRELVQSDTPPGAGPGDAKLIKEHLVKDIDAEKEVDLTLSHTALVDEYFSLLEKRNEMVDSWSGNENRIKAIKNTLIADGEGARFLKIGEHRAKITKVNVKAHSVGENCYYRINIK